MRLCNLFRLGGLIAKASDECLKMLDMLALVAVRRFKLRPPLFLLLQVLLVVAGIKMQPLYSISQ